MKFIGISLTIIGLVGLYSDGGHDFYSEINLWIKDEKAVNLGSHINSETPKTI